MKDIYQRTALLVGEAGVARLLGAHVAVVGIGGVGSYVVEALARAGVGRLTLVDHDTIDATNVNRQLHATQATVGQLKVGAMAERVAAINPALAVVAKTDFVLPENVAQVFDEDYDYIVDAIDTVTAKVALVLLAKSRGIPVICSMGTANKLDNTAFELVDISQTRVCPLARVMRRLLKERGITSGVSVVYAPTAVIKPDKIAVEAVAGRREIPGSLSYVPGTAGLLIAGAVIRELLKSDA